MGRWYLQENPLKDGLREFELVYEEYRQDHMVHSESKFILLHDDGRLEIGTRHSPFTAEYSVRTETK